jgi:hypothetical protein
VNSVQKDAGGGQGPATVGGRTAWLQTGNQHNLLFVPTGLGTTDDAFAIQVDLNWPGVSAIRHEALLDAFVTTNTSGPYQQTEGVVSALIENPVGTVTNRWFHWNGGSYTAEPAAPMTYPSSSWTTYRIEGQRSACRFRSSYGGHDLGWWTGACSLGGSYFALHAGTQDGQPVNMAWSNLRVFRGSEGFCVQPPPRDCGEVLRRNPSAASGNYTVDPDGWATAPPVSVYCEFTTTAQGRCAWQQTASYDLAAMPPGGILDGSGGVGFTTVYGRPALFAPFDWAELFVPTGLAAEASFAVNFDFYVPAPTTWDRGATLHLFTDRYPMDFGKAAHGMLVRFLAKPGGVFRAEHALYSAGAPCAGWDLASDGTFGCSELPLGVAVPSFVGAWHTARVEGVRGASCHVRLLIDGVPVDTFDAACDMTGASFGVGSWYGRFNAENVALSNLKIFRGDKAACVP